MEITEASMFISRRKHEPAHYMLNIQSFSLLSEAQTFEIRSDVFEASGHKWRLYLYPNGCDDENIGSHISLYVEICDTERCSKGWEVCVDVSFFVYDHIHHNFVTFQDVNGHRTRFHENMTRWGFDKLISLESFTESNNGYLLSDSCVFGVEIFEVPQYTQVDRCLFMTKPPATMKTYTWTINQFSAITEKILLSEVFKIGKIKWKLMLYPKGTGLGEGTHLSIFLQVHDADLLPNGWKVYAKFKFRVKCQATESHIEEGADHWFCNSDSIGLQTFMWLTKLVDSQNRFLLNDNLIVEVEISVIGTLRNFI